MLAEDFDRPNGGSPFSPDEKTLYVDDSARFAAFRAFAVAADGAVSGGDVWAELKPEVDESGVPDGMKVNSEGHVFCTGPGGVWVFGDTGPFGLFGRIVMPEVTANLAWGNTGWQTLYMTASTSLYRIRLNVKGIPVGGG